MSAKSVGSQLHKTENVKPTFYPTYVQMYCITSGGLCWILGENKAIYKPANKSAAVFHRAKICCRVSGSNRCGAQQSEISLGSRTTDVQSWPIPICITLFLKRQQQFSNSRKSISQISKSFFLLQFFRTDVVGKVKSAWVGEQDSRRPVSACSKFAF